MVWKSYINASIPSSLHDFVGALIFDVASIGEPATEGDGGDLETGPSEEAVSRYSFISIVLALKQSRSSPSLSCLLVVYDVM